MNGDRVGQPAIIGWDIGGAHVKAARLSLQAAGARPKKPPLEVLQWPCPLWRGLNELEAVMTTAARHWPDLAQCAHAVTMTGEMADCFVDREDGVRGIAALMAARLPGPRFYTHENTHGNTPEGPWCSAAEAGAQWPQLASANWLATARHLALALPATGGLLVDIGSTTTDIVAFAGGRLLTQSRSDAQRLASGELVYHGVVRTPLCALARRVAWRGVEHNVMNELFATTADVYRSTGELDPAHDQQPAADGAGKTPGHTQARLARMVGLDARDGSAADWLQFAREWRAAQVAELRGQLLRVAQQHALGPTATAVAAGCGAFLVPELLPAGWACTRYSQAVAGTLAGAGGADASSAAGPQGWPDVAAPAVAVAYLLAREQPAGLHTALAPAHLGGQA